MDYGAPSAILILAGDHVYKMDYRVMLDFHREKNADVTVAVLRLHHDEIRAKLGNLVVDADSRVVAFEEKPVESDAHSGRARLLPRVPRHLRLPAGTFSAKS